MKQNYHRMMEKEIESLQKKEVRPKLLLHSCCAPCSTYVIEYLAAYFEITVYFFNPNIYPDHEYQKRLQEQIRLVEEMALPYHVEVVGTDHEPERFYEAIKGCEHLPEGGERCWRCYALRLERAVRFGAENQFEYVTTTLSISPLKSAQKLNEIGADLEKRYGIKYFFSDFKKKEGFKKSVALSEKHGLYRQDYCGCVYSQKEAEERQRQKGKNDKGEKWGKCQE